MSKIGLACTFRHCKEDGALIPASTVVHGGPHDGRVAPMIGYIAAFDGSRTIWGFVKYEAPQIFPAPDGDGWTLRPSDPNRPANIATTRVAIVHCEKCKKSVPTPVKGGKDFRPCCPLCGERKVRSEPVKENSAEFDALIAELKEPVDKAARKAYATNPPPSFAFPLVLVGSSSVDPSADPLVPPSAQGAAQAHGRAFRTLVGMGSLGDLVTVGDEDDVDLAIVPGIYAGTMDDKDIREGKSWGSAAIGFYLRMWLPEKKRQASFTSFRY